MGQVYNFLRRGKPDLTSREDRPAEVSSKGHDLGDGFARNLRKMKLELEWVRRIKRVDPPGHGGPVTAAINSTVRLFRHAPYTAAHILWYGFFVVAAVGIVAIIL